MNPKDLKKGKEYLYTASSKSVIVIYKHKTLNGYMFTNGIKENLLSDLSVNNHIEEIK